MKISKMHKLPILNPKKKRKKKKTKNAQRGVEPPVSSPPSDDEIHEVLHSLSPASHTPPPPSATPLAVTFQFSRRDARVLPVNFPAFPLLSVFFPVRARPSGASSFRWARLSSD